MLAEVISIGDELASGQRLDTNSQWLSQRLGDLGIRVLFHTTVADDLPSNVQAFRQAFERVDVVVCTGGLGPTADDLTRQAIADATSTDLVMDDGALQHIRALFARRKREMPERNIVQAMFPRGSRVIPNPHGSAPGIDMDIARDGRAPCRAFALPGVPAEMREMWQATVEPILAAATSHQRRVIRHRQIKCFGVGESDLEQMLPDLIRRGRSPSVGITVSKATITLRITAESDSVEACYAAMEPTVATIRECLGELIFGEEDDELQHAVIRLLAQRQQTLAVVEWGTGGLVSHWLSEVSDATIVFLGSVVVRGEPALTESLGVLQHIVEQHGASSSEVASAMAAACRERFRADYGLAIGPFPPGDEQAGDSGRVHFALAGSQGTQSKSSPFVGHPDILKARSGKQALDLLRLFLRSDS
jgi:nicotinamide-nucleotide amidase